MSHPAIEAALREGWGIESLTVDPNVWRNWIASFQQGLRAIADSPEAMRDVFPQYEAMGDLPLRARAAYLKLADALEQER